MTLDIAYIRGMIYDNQGAKCLYYLPKFPRVLVCLCAFLVGVLT